MRERFGVVVGEALYVSGDESGAFQRELDARQRQGNPVWEHKPLREGPLVGRVEILELRDPVVEQPPASSQQARQACGVDVDPLLPHVLDHADAGDGVELLARQLAIVGHPELDQVGDARLVGPLAGQFGLGLRQRDTDHVGAVVDRGVQRKASPPAAHVEDTLAGS